MRLFHDFSEDNPRIPMKSLPKPYSSRNLERHLRKPSPLPLSTANISLLIFYSRSRIHGRTLRFLGIVLRVLNIQCLQYKPVSN
jgi:hypothetical protein